MIYFKVLRDVVVQEKTLGKIIKKLFLLLKYYQNLNKGISSGQIFHKLKNQNPTIVDLIKQFTKQDRELLDDLFYRDTKEFLHTKKLETHLDFNKKIGFGQVGFNTIYVDKLAEGLWTTGRASFFVPTKKGLNNKISIKMRSIPPLKVTIRYGESQSKTIQMPKLSTKVVEFSIPPMEVMSGIAEIYIKTDKLWLPHVILETNQKIVLGIGVTSINISYF